MTLRSRISTATEETLRSRIIASALRLAGELPRATYA
jgi:hypothetical protein